MGRMDMKVEYRIVKDEYCGFEVQARRWWLPIWFQVGFTNTHRTLKGARKYAERHASGSKFVEYLGRI
jgi:hypothetical protein